MCNSFLSPDLGFMYMSEQVNPESYDIKNMNVIDKHNLFYLEFDAILQTFSVLNRNKRQYLARNIDEQLRTDPKLLALLADNSWFGEMGHPTQDYKQLELTPERIMKIDQNNTSHKVMNPEVVGDILKAKIQTDSSTNAGMNMAKKILQGMIPGFSCRALAKLTTINGIATVIIRKLICYDWVFYQSHKEARNTSDIQAISKNITANQVITESTDTCIPLKEILEYAGRKNVNTQVVMESFELTNDDLFGFSKDAKHILIKDNDNTIYCNMDPKLSKEVRSYLSKL